MVGQHPLEVFNGARVISLRERCLAESIHRGYRAGLYGQQPA